MFAFRVESEDALHKANTIYEIKEGGERSGGEGGKGESYEKFMTHN